MERLSYDAWGKRRNANGTDDLGNALVSASTDHGYTGHEHLDDMGLIHMNGRVYDPRTGRFLQADPTIQSPGNLQSFNRYSYVLNNPFFYTDPSGFSFLGDIWKEVTGTNWTDSRDQYIKPMAIAAISYYGGAWLANAWGGAAVVANGVTITSATMGNVIVQGAASGFISGFLQSDGDLKFAMQSGLAGGLTAGLGNFGGQIGGKIGSAIGASLANGISVSLQGGSFSDAFKNGIYGAIKSQAFQYMQGETDRLADKWWGAQEGGDRRQFDKSGSRWTYGNRGCSGVSGAKGCQTLFPDFLLMGNEDVSHKDWIGIPIVGQTLNAISKVHDFMNEVLTNSYTATGGGRDNGLWVNTFRDVISTVATLPAAKFTFDATMYNNPLRVK